MKEENEIIREKCLSISTPLINYVKLDHDWINTGNCLRTKYFYRDNLHLLELGKKNLSNTIIKAAKHSNVTLPMNNQRDFPALSKHSTKTINPKFLSITPPHINTLFSETACQTHDNRCSSTISVTKTLPQLITTSYMKSKIKAENVTCIKTCPTTTAQKIKFPIKGFFSTFTEEILNGKLHFLPSAITRYYQEKEKNIQEITNFSQHHTQQYSQ